MAKDHDPPFPGGSSSYRHLRAPAPNRVLSRLALLYVVALLAACASTTTHPTPFLSVDSIPRNNPRVIFIGDTQQTSTAEFWRERNDDKTLLLLDEIARRHPAFVIHLGDITTWGNSDAHWAWFDDAAQPIRQARIPCLAILGNHDYFGSNTAALFHVKERFPELQKSLWYSFAHLGVGFILLNSNFGALTDKEKEEQHQWYVRELARFDADPSIRWIVVACHHPPFTNSRVVSPNKKVQTEFAEPFEHSAKGALFFSGHCHSYERFVEGGKTFIVSGGGGGPGQPLETDPGKRAFQDQFDGPSLRFFNFCELTVQPDQLKVDVIRLQENDPETPFAVADRVRVPAR